MTGAKEVDRKDGGGDGDGDDLGYYDQECHERKRSSDHRTLNHRSTTRTHVLSKDPFRFCTKTNTGKDPVWTNGATDRISTPALHGHLQAESINDGEQDKPLFDLFDLFDLLELCPRCKNVQMTAAEKL